MPLHRNELWFAFKLYLWRIEKQHIMIMLAPIIGCDLLSNCIFDVLKNNVNFSLSDRASSCDLLSNCIFDVLKNNAAAAEEVLKRVVICFQIVSLTYWKTTHGGIWGYLPQLWFAFKLYLWRIEKQPEMIRIASFIGCDLLSNCIFDVLKNNIINVFPPPTIVVICFQIVSLTYWKTTVWPVELMPHSCDLLSNCIFDVLKNNLIFYTPQKFLVVICFQIVSLTYWKTTLKEKASNDGRLWFAFKLYLWRIEKQQEWNSNEPDYSCDLLSNCIFDVLKNNFWRLLYWKRVVVICFQIVSLTYWKTTEISARRLYVELWFAFKLYLWRIEKQQAHKWVIKISGCDLLSNCIFDVLKNNDIKRIYLNDVVVICFQIVSLTYWKTTLPQKEYDNAWLWFAFKLYLWRIEKQRDSLCIVNNSCCDLLSNCIFDVLKNNMPLNSLAKADVVICFQIVSLTYWKTTRSLHLTFVHRVVICFQIVSLTYWKTTKPLSA